MAKIWRRRRCVLHVRRRLPIELPSLACALSVVVELS
jgi:hypothetical protein